MSQGQAFLDRAGVVLTLLVGCVLIGGCVHRQFTVTTNPPGAIVQVNGQTIGATPVDVPFIYYGTYRLTILRDGFQTLVVDEPVPAPWYEYFPLEFISEHLIPWTIRDHRRFHYDLKPLQLAAPDQVLGRAGLLRSQGQVIGIPVTGPVGPVTVPAQKMPLEPFELLPTPNPLPQEPLPPPNVVPPGTGPGQPPLPPQPPGGLELP